ncbi:MAG: PAS domain-containing protein, partial [Panacagrimonas sp.]
MKSKPAAKSAKKVKTPVRKPARKPAALVNRGKIPTALGSKSETAALERANLEGQIAAINRSQAVIEFTLDGRILHANDNFLNTLGYALDEVKGQHHSMFVDAVTRSSIEYRMFWDKLARGEYDAGQYKRIAKNGKEIWIQATYNPVNDAQGKPCKVIKFATDITAQKLQAA